MVLEFNPSRFPDSLLKGNTVSKFIYFLLMAGLVFVIGFLFNLFIYKIGLLSIIAISLIVALGGTRNGLDKLKELDKSTKTK